MNIYRPILKMIVLSLALLNNGALLSMKSDYKDTLTVPRPDRIKNLLSDVKGHLIDHFDNPITFGQTNKENHELVKRHGQHNICRAYHENDPCFVLTHYVPILPFCTHRDKNEYRFDIISP